MNTLAVQKLYIKNADGFIEFSTLAGADAPFPVFNVWFMANASQDPATQIRVRLSRDELEDLGRIISCALQIGM